MKHYELNPIGKITSREGTFLLELEKKYIPALQGLEGFSHLAVLWWFDGCDNGEDRSVLEVKEPYRRAPAVLGTFATRSPERPNPIAVSIAQILGIDAAAGTVELAYIDANDGTPLLDIKPYTPSLDRVLSPAVPDWCSHWPQSLEDSADFAWEDEFNF